MPHASCFLLAAAVKLYLSQPNALLCSYLCYDAKAVRVMHKDCEVSILLLASNVVLAPFAQCISCNTCMAKGPALGRWVSGLNADVFYIGLSVQPLFMARLAKLDE